MSRGLDGNRTGDIGSARRKHSRRTAAALARQEQMKRLRANERKNVKKYLRPAVGVARKSAEEHGFEVQIERTNGATGWKQLFRWTEAVIRLGPVDISVRFELADKQSPASLSTIRIYAAHTLLRTCPADLLQSGDEQAFETWLSRHLEKAVKRSRGRG